MRESRVLARFNEAPPTTWHRDRIVCCLVLMAAFLAPSVIIAQQSASAESASVSASAPAGQQSSSLTIFVSRLKAEPVDYQIKLTWMDSPDIKGSCLVYRALEEITTQTIGQAQLIGTVATGTAYFIDTPPDRKGYFYAVIIRDDSGTLYPITIPFRNKTSAAVTSATTAPEEKLAARISAIKAVVTAAGDGIEITFASSNPGRDLLLFWGPSPFTGGEDLLESVSTAPLDPGTTRYVLAALPGVDYWFAVLDAGMYKLGKAEIEKGTNATVYSVGLSADAGRSALSSSYTAAHRSTPLPSLALSHTVQGGQALASIDVPELPATKKVSKVTEEAISRLMKGVKRQATKYRRPQVLPVDATPSPNGEVTRLQEIIRGPFIAGDMTSAKKGLLDFLRLPRSLELEAHARFYLGQVYYIEGGVRQALMEFLIAGDCFYQESEPWIDACFERLEKQGL